MEKKILNLAICMLLAVQPAWAAPAGNAVPGQALLIIFVVLGLLLVWATILLFKSRRKSGIGHEQLRQLVLLQEKDRQQISAELHNTVGQDILFIRNQLVKNGQSEVVAAVDTALAGIRNVSQALYPVQLEKFGLSAAVESLAEKMQEKSSVFVSHDLEVLDKALDEVQKIHCYRIIEACMLQAVQRVEVSAIRISAQYTGKGFALEIKDNGKPEPASKFGKIEAHIQCLKGKSEIRYSPESGTHLTIYIPA